MASFEKYTASSPKEKNVNNNNKAGYEQIRTVMLLVKGSTELPKKNQLSSLIKENTSCL